jgi:hypothetical protein
MKELHHVVFKICAAHYDKQMKETETEGKGGRTLMMHLEGGKNVPTENINCKSCRDTKTYV